MKRYLLPLLFSALLLAGLNACTERIEIELHSEDVRLAVEGYITPDSHPGSYVRLTETAAYFANQPPPPVSGAVVTVDDGENLYLFDEDPENPGYYPAPNNFYARNEKTYKLTIELAEPIGGESHFEATETLPALSDRIDSIQLEYREDFDFWGVKFYGYDPVGPNFYMFGALLNGAPLTDSISKVTVTDDKLIEGGYVNGAYVMRFRGNDFEPGDQFTLIMSSISGSYYEYVYQVQIELEDKNPLFSGPPANVSTNISNGAVGYFAAYSSAYASTVIK